MKAAQEALYVGHTMPVEVAGLYPVYGWKSPHRLICTYDVGLFGHSPERWQVTFEPGATAGPGSVAYIQRVI